MYLLEICLLLPITSALVGVKIFTNSLYDPKSTWAFIRNASLPNNASIQSCIWKCVYEDYCQTAVYFNREQICSMFVEFYQSGRIQPSVNFQAHVICYQRDQSKLFLFGETLKMLPIIDPIRTCLSIALPNNNIHTTLSTQLQTTAAGMHVSEEQENINRSGYLLKNSFTLTLKK